MAKTNFPTGSANAGKPPSKQEQEMRKLERLLTDVRTAITEAHGVLSDIRTERRLVREEIASGIRKLLEAETEQQLTILRDATKRAITLAEERVNARFDLLAAILMGEDRESKREGKPSLPELVEKYCRTHGISLPVPTLITETGDSE